MTRTQTARKRTWIGARIGVSLACLMLGISAAVMAAPASLVTPEGDLVVVQELTRGPYEMSLALRWTLHRADGTRQQGIVPGTRDRALDGFPTLTLDPDTGRPALVWSRHNGSDFDLVLSVHDGTSWGQPIPLVTTSGHEIHPRAFTAPGEGIHVFWRYPGQVDSFEYALFRTDSGAMVRGPEKVFPALLPAGGLIEGGGDEPGIQPGSPPPPGDGDVSSDGDGECHRRMCKESTSPVDGSASCNRVAVAARVADSICVVTRDDQTWRRLACAPAGSVDVKAALQALASASCGD